MMLVQVSERSSSLGSLSCVTVRILLIFFRIERRFGLVLFEMLGKVAEQLFGFVGIV